jgi:hypothetical protein
MSPFVFSADAARFSAEVREIRAGLLVDQIDASWEEVRGDESAELTVRAIAAAKTGDWAALDAIAARAEEIDAANPVRSAPRRPAGRARRLPGRRVAH